MNNKIWICKICGRKIIWILRWLKLWYHSDDYGGKVHWWCYHKPKNKDRSLNLKFA